MKILLKLHYKMTELVLHQEIKSTNRERKICYNDISTICSWVRNQRALSMVSGDKGNGLSPLLFNKWIDNSSNAIVIADKDKNEPLGFCTITIRELSSIKPSYIELCHLIVKPHRNQLNTGIELCLSAFDSAKNLGFKFMIGRVVQSNYFGHSLAKATLWNQVTNQLEVPRDFTWYIKSLDVIH